MDTTVVECDVPHAGRFLAIWRCLGDENRVYRYLCFRLSRTDVSPGHGMGLASVEVTTPRALKGMIKRQMRFHRIENPASLGQTEIVSIFESGAEFVILQFSKSAAYNEQVLGKVNALCEHFGSRLNVRFYGHYGSDFDCQTLRHIPSVRSLHIDCLMKVLHLDCIDELAWLEEFVFGVFEADAPFLLKSKALTRLRSLTLTPTRKNNIDLAPLESYAQLEELFISGHTRHIDSIATLPRLQKLFLRQIGKKAPLSFIKSIAPLKALTYILGGRLNMNDLAHDGLERLEIVRVLGLAEINLALFPQLERLTVEDQLRLNELDIRPSRKLQRLSIMNCKNLTSIVGIDSADSLKSLRIGRTAIELNEVLDHLPANIKGLTLCSPSQAIDKEVQLRIGSIGLPSAYYTGAP